MAGGEGGESEAGARLWDRMGRREPLVFGVRTPEREALLLVQYRRGTEAFFSSVAVGE